MKGEQGVRREKENVREIWRLNCEQLAQHDAESVSKDAEIASLKARLCGLESDEVHRQSTNHKPPHVAVVECSPVPTTTLPPQSTVHATPPTGPELATSQISYPSKAPPLNDFTGCPV